MSKHAALDRFGKSGNPLIRSDLSQKVALDNEEVTTLDGAVNKTAILLALTVSTAAISWNFQGPMMGLISGIGVAAAMISAIATFGLWIFSWIIKPTPHRAPYTAPIYADRKSTRLNSSHALISYAVFCLKKKKKIHNKKTKNKKQKIKSRHFIYRRELSNHNT